MPLGGGSLIVELGSAGAAGIAPAAAAGDDVGVAEVRDDVVSDPNAGADEGRDVPPRAEVEVDVGEEQPFRLAAGVVVGVVDAGIEEAVERMEVGLAAIFAGNIEAQPGVPGIADAEAEEWRAVKAAPVVPGEGGRSREARMRQAFELFVAHADVADNRS